MRHRTRVPSSSGSFILAALRALCPHDHSVQRARKAVFMTADDNSSGSITNFMIPSPHTGHLLSTLTIAFLNISFEFEPLTIK